MRTFEERVREILEHTEGATDLLILSLVDEDGRTHSVNMALTPYDIDLLRARPRDFEERFLAPALTVIRNQKLEHETQSSQ